MVPCFRPFFATFSRRGFDHRELRSWRLIRYRFQGPDQGHEAAMGRDRHRVRLRRHGDVMISSTPQTEQGSPWVRSAVWHQEQRLFRGSEGGFARYGSPYGVRMESKRLFPEPTAGQCRHQSFDRHTNYLAIEHAS
jgi:hypothetical protein